MTVNYLITLSFLLSLTTIFELFNLSEGVPLVENNLVEAHQVSWLKFGAVFKPIRETV